LFLQEQIKGIIIMFFSLAVLRKLLDETLPAEDDLTS
jgi:hypothetical protein